MKITRTYLRRRDLTLCNCFLLTVFILVPFPFLFYFTPVMNLLFSLYNYTISFMMSGVRLQCIIHAVYNCNEI